MVRGAAIGFVVSILLTTVAAWLMSTGAVHAQQGPRHVFSGAVRNAGNDVYFGNVSFLDMSGQEVANVDVNDARYKIAVVEPAGRKYSGQAFRITVHFGDRIYERAQRVNWQAGGVTVLDLEFGAQAAGWSFRRAPSQAQRQQDQQRMDQNAEDRDRRMEMDEQRMERESEESARRMEMEQQDRDRESKMREREGEERREMERQRLERETEESKERMEMERQRLEMDQQRMGRGQPGVQPVAGERPKSGPSRGLFSNRAAGEATSGIDNIMDPTMLTIIGIALTVFTTGMTLFKGD